MRFLDQEKEVDREGRRGGLDVRRGRRERLRVRRGGVGGMKEEGGGGVEKGAGLEEVDNEVRLSDSYCL